MSSVAARVFASSPARAADQTWTAIVELLTHGVAGANRDELEAVSGTASALIADRAPDAAAIVVTCEGPRTRIRCAYDEDAVDGSGVNEEPMAFDPLKGDWSISLPCAAEDLAWVQSSLARKSTRITARDLSETVTPIASAASADGGGGFEIDLEGFLS